MRILRSDLGGAIPLDSIFHECEAMVAIRNNHFSLVSEFARSDAKKRLSPDETANRKRISAIIAITPHP